MGPRNSEKIGALLSAEGAIFNSLVPLTAVWGLGTLASNFRGPGTAFPTFPLTLTTDGARTLQTTDDRQTDGRQRRLYSERSLKTGSESKTELT